VSATSYANIHKLVFEISYL